MDEVPWLVEVMHKQLKDGGVNYQPDEGRLSGWFSNRDHAWCARAKDLSGETHRKSFPVSRFGTTQDGRRRPLSMEELKKQKSEVYDGLMDWVGQIQTGCLPV